MHMHLLDYLRVLKKAMAAYYKDNCQILSAALAYYTLFSLAPILFIAAAFSGILFSRESAEQYLIERLSELIGSKSASAVGDAVQNLSSPTTNIVFFVIGFIFLAYIASTVFANLKISLNRIWGIRQRVRHPLVSLLKNRLWAFLVLLIVYVLIIFSVITSLLITALSTVVDNRAMFYFFQAIDVLLWFSLITLLFGTLYIILPNRKIGLKQGIPGALMGALLFTVGKFIISIYLSKSSIGTIYGTAGSLIILLIWLYFSSQIFFIGAEITKVYVLEKEKKA